MSNLNVWNAYVNDDCPRGFYDGMGALAVIAFQ